MGNKFFKAKIIFSLLFVYVILFELVFPKNNFLPRPLTVVESFVPLVVHYLLFIHLSITLSVLMFGVFTGYFFFYLLSKVIIKLGIFSGGNKKESVLLLIPLSIIIIGFFKYWNLNSFVYEFIFSSVFIAVLLLNEFIRFCTNHFASEYNYILVNLGINKNSEKLTIMIKTFLPSMIKNFETTFSSYFLLLIIYEALINNSGVGSLFMHLFYNKDLAGFIALLVIVLITYFLIKYVFAIFFEKYIFWDNIDE